MLRIFALELMVDNLEGCAFCFLPFFPLSDVVSMWLTRHRDVNRLEYEFRCSVGWKGACVCLWEHVSLHMCVFGKLVLTQTQPLHCPAPSVVRMFEGRFIAWLPLISAGTENPVAGRTRPQRIQSEPGHERHGTGELRACKVTDENYGGVNYRFLMSCFKIAGSEITHGITLNPPSNPLI